MASASQLRALLKSHVEGGDDRFFPVAMQVAADEARGGHGKLAGELRTMVDDARSRRGLTSPARIGRSRGGLAVPLEESRPKTRLTDMSLGERLCEQIRRIIREQRHAGTILEHGLAPTRKPLLLGPSGTGKTMTASVLAGELGLPLVRTRPGHLDSGSVGEIRARLGQVFDAIGGMRGVYLFDDVDAPGSHRGRTDDMDRVHRVLDSLPTMLEQDRSHSLVMAATNHPDAVEPALFRCLDDVLHYEFPDRSQIARLLKVRLSERAVKATRWAYLAESAIGLGHAEVVRSADDVLKDALISQRTRVREPDIARMLKERAAMSRRLRKNGGSAGETPAPGRRTGPIGNIGTSSSGEKP